MSEAPPLRQKNAKGPRTAEYFFRDKDGIERVGKGRIFEVPVFSREIDGEAPSPRITQALALFPIGVLCGILGRTHRTIYKWEAEYGFPKSLYLVKDDEQTKRWYSTAQLKLVQKLYEQAHRLRAPPGAIKLERRKIFRDFINGVNVGWHLDALMAPKEDE